ncbi:hypothetical protein V6N11_054698 [Hibiscus sabdariffa]|uniref:Uncharacterized protein n=1 Tax=Hibiscus sabdariffa TaxID=183260 RepID=A0ABR2S4N8_9ROSI
MGTFTSAVEMQPPRFRTKEAGDCHIGKGLVLPPGSEAPANTCSSPISVVAHHDTSTRSDAQPVESEVVACCTKNTTEGTEFDSNSARLQDTGLDRLVVVPGSDQFVAAPGSDGCAFSELPESIGIVSSQLERSTAYEVPVKNGTWELVPLPVNRKAIGSK